MFENQEVPSKKEYNEPIPTKNTKLIKRIMSENDCSYVRAANLINKYGEAHFEPKPKTSDKNGTAKKDK